MNQVYLSIGGNLGYRRANLALATQLIKQEIGVLKKRSAFYKTKAWGIENQPDFLNQCLYVETLLSPQEVMQIALKIETKMGRVRARKWYTRLIDIDILFYNQLIINTKDLIIPHPHLHTRNFVLVPLTEIAPELVHPILKKNIKELYEKSPDKLGVKKLSI